MRSLYLWMCHCDNDNRVRQIKKSDDADEVAAYMYDAVAPAAVRYFYDGQRVLVEGDEYGNGRRSYVYGNYIDEVLVMIDYTAQPDTDYFFGQDHLSSTAALLDDAGNVVERYEYDAYGTTDIMDASYNSRTVSSYGNPYTFTGRRLDVLDAGNLFRVHYRHRDYDTYAGRFVQHDPLGVDFGGGLLDQFSPLEQCRDGASLYEYVGSMPSNFIDPFGKSWWDPRTWWPREDRSGRPDPTKDPFCWGVGLSGICIDERDPAEYPPGAGAEPGSRGPRQVPPSMGNCFRFACNDPVKPGESHSPNMYNRDCIEYNRLTCAGVRKDARDRGLKDPKSDGSCEAGESKVAFAVGSGRFPGRRGDPYNDVHWYRQEPNGQWCDKPGYLPINCSSTDPRDQERKTPDGRYEYDWWCGYMCVPENVDIDW